ncbi:hypothetical protein FisN_32Lh016 [Fistulifera solaris]|uniref:Peptidase M43 pregnancy-associated plasma-A domain-containing protein n=1 Tax=Fistulifera solaris TaxID=1519565 RepID=A0A1Z5KNR7_FISSO|nr:hypothetical protein FisN_32Lh016 [Fistulifera solaris]|eukprot:GAX27963.1 hypothetical protein FisN_32Lh016 [Fistulifera solaris]
MAKLTVFLFCALSAPFVLSHDHEDNILHGHGHHRLLSQKPRGCGYQAPDSATIQKMAIAQEERVARVEQERGFTSQIGFPCIFGRARTEIDTYLHAIQMTDGTGFLSDAVLKENIRVTNKLLSSTGFQLNVVLTNRVTSDSWYMSNWDSPEQNAMERQYKEGGLNTLNVYYKAAILGNERFCGYANSAENAVSMGTRDGVVIDSGCTGGIDETTLAHEVGHWMNLLHTFDGGCSPGDMVDDTNAQASYHGIYEGKCPNPLPDTCPNQRGRDPLDNIMDYAPSGCDDIFTRGQARRMQEAWRNIRDV